MRSSPPICKGPFAFCASFNANCRPACRCAPDIEAAKAMLANPDIGVTQIAHRLGVSPATVALCEIIATAIVTRFSDYSETQPIAVKLGRA